MPSKKNMMKKNLENMHLQERINYGYRKVIIMMLVSGLFSIVVIGMLFANMMHYIENVNAADQAVKICRINVNAAARNIREMALENDASSYEFNISDFNEPGKAFGEEELQAAIKRGAIQILDDATIEAMKAKRARDKARDEAERQKEAVASGEQTDWQEAMKEWNEYYEK